jgi:hypothetical protein
MILGKNFRSIELFVAPQAAQLNGLHFAAFMPPEAA